MLDRLYATLDSRFLSRVSNLRTLATIALAAGLVVIGIVLAAVSVLTRAGWVPLLFVGAGLLLFVLLGQSRVRAARQRRARALDPAIVAVAERLQASADQIEALFHARQVEEPRRPQPWGLGRGLLSLESEMAAAETEHYEALETYRRRTMALYYERHRAGALNAWDAGYPLGYAQGRERDRGIVQEPAGTAALRLVPGILRDMGWKLIG
jgi:hypothetical protein